MFKNKVNVLRVLTKNTGFMKEGQRNGEKQERKLFRKIYQFDIHASLEKKSNVHIKSSKMNENNTSTLRHITGNI